MISVIGNMFPELPSNVSTEVATANESGEVEAMGDLLDGVEECFLPVIMQMNKCSPKLGSLLSYCTAMEVLAKNRYHSGSLMEVSNRDHAIRNHHNKVTEKLNKHERVRGRIENSRYIAGAEGVSYTT